MSRWAAVVSGIAAVAYLFLFSQLGRSVAEGPPRADVMLWGDVPATLFMPPGSPAFREFRQPAPQEQRPPGVVVVHGFANDRVGMSAIARRLADAGYAALAIDLAGHGENRHPFRRGWAQPDRYFAELSAAVDFLRTSPHVDGTRIAVMGLSMGAGAALDYATRDSGIDAVVLMSGGWSMSGPYRPPNALFVFAENDPGRVKRRARELASLLAGVPESDLSRDHGDVALGTAVRVVEVPGESHASIGWSKSAAREVVGWLDAVFGRERAGDVADDPRVAPLVAIGVVLLLVLPGFGVLVGRLVPTLEELPAEGRPVGLLALALALALTMPLLALGAPAEIVSLQVADFLVSHFALAGIALLAMISWRGSPPASGLWVRPGRLLLGVVVAMIGVYVMLMPLGGYLHRLALTPERMLAFGLAALGFFPLSLSQQLLLRRGAPIPAALWAIAGRLVVLIVILLGIWTGVLESVLAFIVGPLFGILIFVEILAASIYAESRNLLAIAVVDAASLALLLAATMPIRL